MEEKGQSGMSNKKSDYKKVAVSSSFVLDKSIFSNVFERDIRRVYVYKKVERLAKALHLVAPAFRVTPSLRDRIDRIAVTLIDAAIMPPLEARERLSRELLALSSILSIARSGSLLSPMNADLIAHEAHLLLQEIASYEEPRVSLEESPSLAMIARVSGSEGEAGGRIDHHVHGESFVRKQANRSHSNKGHLLDTVKDTPLVAASSRREAILSVLRAKDESYIKDISMVVRDVSEKTIQRELAALVSEGIVTRKGDRRWTTYTLTRT